MRVSRVSLRRTKSAIISWDGSNYFTEQYHEKWELNIVQLVILWTQMSRRMTKPTKWLCAQQRLSQGICPFWSESSLSAWRKLVSWTTHWAHSEDSDQTDPTDAQTDLSLCWACMSFCCFLSWGSSNTLPLNRPRAKAFCLKLFIVLCICGNNKDSF